MRHPEHPFDPEADAAAYVSGAMTPARRRRFEGHLLDCERCWVEVSMDREGRRLADSAREVAPAGLRDAVRAGVAGSTQSQRARRPLPRIIAVAATFLLVATLGSYLGRSRTPAEPPSIQAALDVYRNHAATGAGIDHAPDLAAAGLKLTGSERMSLADIPVEAFAYREASGGTLWLFMADSPFPRAGEASSGPSALPATWEAQRDGMGMLSGSQPASYLVITADQALMERFAGGLSSGQVSIAV